MESGTDAIRSLAPRWTLAGDDALITLLNNTHQKILSNCKEINAKLEEMTSSLDDASINLQNVNNKFMSLSNCQFIESRVYDDDGEVSTDVQTNKETPKPIMMDEVSMLKNTLTVLESTHETTEIIDESDSDSDVEISLVLKPKDFYSHRPLPYIIGSQQWKNKWHAGLVIEHSDTESSISKEHSDVEYSESEEEIPTDRHANDNTISESSSLQSEEKECKKPTAADIAADIASRLAGPPPVIVREEYSPPPLKKQINTQPVFKPNQPITSTVYSDEPPPLDQSETSEEEDIFAEINKTAPYKKKTQEIPNNLFDTNTKQNVVDELFAYKGTLNEKEPLPNKPKPPLFEDVLKPESFEENSTKIVKEPDSPKKPVGGISVFGSNKNTDTIAAAILNRNRRHSSSSTGSDAKTTDETDNQKKETDIFDDLFAKNKKHVEKIEKNENKKVDLFKDDLFDDVDDIFTAVPSKTVKQSLFDDDDDLFKDVAAPKVIESSSKNKSIVKDKLFDSDDDLFSDIKTVTVSEPIKKTQTKPEIPSKTTQHVEPVSNIKTSKLFESDDELPSAQTSKTTQQVQPTLNIPKKQKSIFDSDSDDDLFNFKSTTNNNTLKTKSTEFKSPNLFEDDEIDDLFANKSAPEKRQGNENLNDIQIGSKILEKNVTIAKEKHPTVLTGNNLNTTLKLDAEVTKSPTTNNIANLNKEVIDKVKSSELFDYSEKSTLITEQQSLNSNISTEINDVANKTITEVNSSKLLEDKSNTNIRQESLNCNLNKETSDRGNNNSNIKANNTLFTEEESSKSNENENIFEIKDTDELDKSLFSSSTNNGQIKEINKEPIFNIDAELDQDLFSNKAVPEESILENKSPNKNDFSEKDIKDQTANTNEQNIDNIFKDNDSFKNTNVPIIDDIPPSPIMDSNPPEDSIFKIPTMNTEIPSIPILTEPPAFEKVKEKKQSNVNALFEEDSEDEGFFKKSEVISDEKPNIFTSGANFGLFLDEPPDLDAFDENLFSNSGQKSPIDKSQSIDNKPPEDYIFKNANTNEDNDKLFSKDISSEKDSSIKPSSSKIDVIDKSLFSHSIKDSKIEFNDDIFNDSPKQEVNILNNNEDKSEDFLSKKVDKLDNNLLTKEIEDKNNIKSNEIVRKSELKSQSLFENDSDEDIFGKVKPVTNIFERTKDFENKNSIFDDLDDNLFKNQNTVSSEADTQKSPKIIGKINSNLNINVQALIPGASPKKNKPNTEPETIKSTEITDPSTEPQAPTSPISKKPDQNTEESNSSSNAGPMMVKSVSFEEDPDSEILDNKLSKHRPRIQVKRRPSSRKARHEAARKSAIDFDDSTHKTIRKDDEISKSQDSIFSEPLEKQSIVSENFDKLLKLTAKETDFEPHQKQLSSETQKEKNTKIVYVLNDEDIFTNLTKNDTVIETRDECSKTDSHASRKSNFEQNKDKTNVNTKKEDNLAKTSDTSIKSDKSDLKTDKENKNQAENPTKTTTSAKTDEISTKNKQNVKTKSLFDSDDDDLTLFKAKPVVKKTKLFDSDSEDDLFGGSKTKSEPKKGLFDDSKVLFGATSKQKTETKQKPTSSKETTKTVFTDPLSLFGED